MLVNFAVIAVLDDRNIFTMGLDVKSKLVVITGSAGGLGKAFAIKLLTLGKN